MSIKKCFLIRRCKCDVKISVENFRKIILLVLTFLIYAYLAVNIYEMQSYSGTKEKDHSFFIERCGLEESVNEVRKIQKILEIMKEVCKLRGFQ